jgi:hypothetical protein
MCIVENILMLVYVKYVAIYMPYMKQYTCNIWINTCIRHETYKILSMYFIIMLYRIKLPFYKCSRWFMFDAWYWHSCLHMPMLKFVWYKGCCVNYSLCPKLRKRFNKSLWPKLDDLFPNWMESFSKNLTIRMERDAVN